MPSNAAVCDVLVGLYDENDQLIGQDITDVNGNFSFPTLNPNTNYSLQLEKQGAAVNGTSTFDLVMYARAILGIQPLSQYQQWTADVNGTGTLSTLDLILIRKVILGVDDSFLTGNWLFGFPGDTQGSTNLAFSTGTNNLDLDIIGVKVADANFSAIPCE